jgi:Na+-translocating ferredoxin:NAD+ oxidoreductase RnfC subunit
MLCGSCSYVCPSNIPLAQLFTASKAAIRRVGAA